MEHERQDHEHQREQTAGGEGRHLSGIHISRKSLWLIAGGAIGAFAALGLDRAANKVRPAIVGAVKEGYGFKEWIATRFESLKEDVEDIVAEGVHQHKKDLAATADAVAREKEILQKIEKVVAQRLSKMEPKKGEG